MAAMCGAVLLSEDDDIRGRVMLRCDLVEHNLALRQHFDKKHSTEWWQGHNDPAPVPYSPTGPMKKIGAKI